MAPGRRRGAGCWTCRLRHKRCDSVRPICEGCQNLEITCYSDKARPPWMDGGSGQKHMAGTIKGRIKQNALLRRERRRLIHEDQGVMIATESDHVSHTDHVNISILNAPNGNFAEYVPSLSTSSVQSTALQSANERSEASQSPFTIASPASNPVTLPTGSSSSPSRPASLVAPIQAELGPVMIYLDYVFPFLFPFYQPSLLETGRQWVLGLLCQNEASFYIAASLGAYFFSIVPQQDGQDMHDDCKALVRNKLVEQMDKALSSIQSTVLAMNHHGAAQSPLLDKARIMEEITQLLIVEVTVRTNVEWTIHLTPALVLFDEIFKSHGVDHLEPSLAVLLSALPSSIPIATPHHKPLPYTADQSTLVFFVSLLLFVDIIASTSLGAPPALQSYHHSLLSPQAEGNCRVQLENVIGCQNWALVAIGNISALCAWKRDAQQYGNFSVVHLVNLAAPISQAIEEGLTSLDFDAARSQTKKVSASRLEAYYSRLDRAIDGTVTANVTRIWAYAAKIYLSICHSGWQTNSTDIQASVAKILSLLQTIESLAQLRSLSWPICVAGCLALKSQEDDFRRIIGIMGQLGDFGTVSNALRIMEAGWSFRDTVDGNVWDIASSFGIFGSPALLF